MRAKRAIPAAQNPRRVARLAQILRYAKSASLRMTSKFSHYPAFSRNQQQLARSFSSFQIAVGPLRFGQGILVLDPQL